MLGTEVDSVVTDLAVNPFSLRFQSGSFGVLGRSLVGEMGEGRVGLNKLGGLVAGRLGLTTRNRGGYRAGTRNGCVERGGAEAEPFGRIARQASERSGHGG